MCKHRSASPCARAAPRSSASSRTCRWCRRRAPLEGALRQPSTFSRRCMRSRPKRMPKRSRAEQEALGLLGSSRSLRVTALELSPERGELLAFAPATTAAGAFPRSPRWRASARRSISASSCASSRGAPALAAAEVDPPPRGSRLPRLGSPSTRPPPRRRRLRTPGPGAPRERRRPLAEPSASQPPRHGAPRHGPSPPPATATRLRRRRSPSPGRPPPSHRSPPSGGRTDHAPASSPSPVLARSPLTSPR